MRRPSAPAEADLRARGSRFLAFLSHVSTPESAAESQRSRLDRNPDATHHCWAYRLWRPETVETGAFDGGEPSGTAGRPILGALERADLVDALCLVTRWFGGTKLGTGGLIRAYDEATRRVVELAIEEGRAPRVEPRADLEIRFPYRATADVRRIAARFGAREEAAGYGESVRIVLSIRPVDEARLVDALREAGSGEISVAPLGTRLGDAGGS